MVDVTDKTRVRQLAAVLGERGARVDIANDSGTRALHGPAAEALRPTLAHAAATFQARVCTATIVSPQNANTHALLLLTLDPPRGLCCPSFGFRWSSVVAAAGPPLGYRLGA